MPRVHIHLHDIDEIADLEEQEDWEQLIGLDAGGHRDSRVVADPQRGSRGFRELRFGGSEAIDRKRAERRKHNTRPGRRASQ
jgi:hypothetical protein